MRGVRSRRGGSNTTKSVRTAAWDTGHRRSLRRRRQRPSTQLSEGQGTQTPSLAPRAPPSRLKPKMERMKVVVFLRERKQGAGHPFDGSAAYLPYCSIFNPCGNIELVNSISTDSSGYALSADACYVENDECYLVISETSADG